jgi:hypothetical protein
VFLKGMIGGSIDFKEIPQENIANGYQDTFELFPREFFEGLGFKIDINLDRGQVRTRITRR